MKSAPGRSGSLRQITQRARAQTQAQQQQQQQGPVEARSLSSITALASNPPAYPRNPTQRPLEPLVLYIVRVPGSRDVFLTPLKPPTKSSVSAEAINSSLYYLHVATQDDEAVLRSIELERQEWERQQRELGLNGNGNGNGHAEGGATERLRSVLPPGFARLNNIRRKPVGGGRESPTRPPCPTSAPPPPPPPPHQPPPPPYEEEQTQQEERQEDSMAGAVVLSPPPLPPRHRPRFESEGAEVDDSNTASDAIASVTPHRPLPPLPEQENNPPSKTGEAAGTQKRWSAQPEYLGGRGLGDWKDQCQDTPRSGRFSLDAAARRPRFQEPGSPSYNLNPPLNNQNRRRTSPSAPPPLPPRQSPTRGSHDSTRDSSDSSFTITLIRRDPTSGSQWNVGTISSSSADVDRSIDIEISTPGYNKFTGRNEPLNLASLGINLPLALAGHQDGGGSSRPASFPTPGQAQNEKNGNSNADHRPKTFHRKLLVSTPPAKHQNHNRDGSRTSTDTFDGGSPNRPSFGFGPSYTTTTSSSSTSKMKTGYYTFTSPWNGTCAFVASINGRSLKCKHTIPGPQTSHSNGNNDDDHSVTTTVAEIRFNMPIPTGHPHDQSNHHSPFSLSQAGISFSSSTNREQYGGKRSSLAFLLNPNTYYRPHSSSNPETSSSLPFRPRARSRSNTRMHTRSDSNNSSSTDGVGDERNNNNNHPPPSQRPNDNDNDDDEDRLDLSLAREHAGGGLRGKSAKLGKLIVEDEGIKMLDLVVAASMGVWWRCYYF
ncbi:hypothetical protein VTN00DRAFT_5657 [Thermoascus crustaceus]|uniref:uncharacterized protein n=1 Tax=Thermoascus crustaceus TaxID=5088 RepID=UPI003744579F